MLHFRTNGRNADARAIARAREAFFNILMDKISAGVGGDGVRVARLFFRAGEGEGEGIIWEYAGVSGRRWCGENCGCNLFGPYGCFGVIF